MTDEYLRARIEALELELEATVEAYTEANRNISKESSLNILKLAVERIKIQLIKQKEDGTTSIQNDQH